MLIIQRTSVAYTIIKVKLSLGYSQSMTLLYTNIDMKQPNKLHGPKYCKIGVTCVYNGHVFYTLL